MILFVDYQLEFLGHIDLLPDYFFKFSTLHSKKTLSILASVVDFGFEGHPQRHTMHYLQHDASKRPDVNDPRMRILFDFFQQLLIVVEAILIQNVV